jgi:hypothetical protein
LIEITFERKYDILFFALFKPVEQEHGPILRFSHV